MRLTPNCRKHNTAVRCTVDTSVLIRPVARSRQFCPNTTSSALARTGKFSLLKEHLVEFNQVRHVVGSSQPILLQCVLDIRPTNLTEVN